MFEIPGHNDRPQKFRGKKMLKVEYQWKIKYSCYRNVYCIQQVEDNNLKVGVVLKQWNRLNVRDKALGQGDDGK